MTWRPGRELDVGIALAIGADGERRHRDPGHRELDDPFALKEVVAKDRHHVRDGRELEVAVQRMLQAGGVDPGGRQVEVPFLARRSVPDAVDVAVEVEFTTPPVADARHAQTRRHELWAGFELVVEPVGKRPCIDGYAHCREVVLGDRDLCELDAERVVLHPGDHSASLRTLDARLFCHRHTNLRGIRGNDLGHPVALHSAELGATTTLAVEENAGFHIPATSAAAGIAAVVLRDRRGRRLLW